MPKTTMRIKLDQVRDEKAKEHLHNALAAAEKEFPETSRQAIEIAGTLANKNYPKARELCEAMELHAKNGFNPLHLALALQDGFLDIRRIKHSQQETIEMDRSLVQIALAAARKRQHANITIRRALGELARSEKEHMALTLRTIAEAMTQR